MRGSIGKRILVLFLLCVLLPIGCIAILSLEEISDNFREQINERLHHACKSVNMGILQGLGFLQSEMEALASSPGGHAGKSSGHFLGLTRFRDGAGAEPLFGSPCPPPPPIDGMRNHLDSGKAVTFVREVPGGLPRVYMAVPSSREMPGKGVLVGEVHPKYLGEIIEAAMPVEGDLTVLDSSGVFLYNPRSLPAEVVRRVNGELRSTHAGQFEWNLGSDPVLVNFRSIFMRGPFLSRNWVIVITTSRDQAFAPIRFLTRVFVLIVGLTLLVVSLLIIVQIRRNLVPLAKLKEGTRKIRGGDFESRIEVHSGDEFEELAHSFNRMTERLGKEFHALTETGRIVRSVLTGLERETIIKTVLANLRTVVPCETVAISLMNPGGNGSARTYVEGSGTGESADLQETLAVLTPEESQRLRMTDGSLVVESGDGFPGLLSPLSGDGGRTFVLLPLLCKEQMAGILAMGYGKGTARAREDILRARQIADQVAVALENTGLIEELAALNLGAMTALARAVDAKSSWTAGHSERVTALSMKIGRAMGLTSEELNGLQRGGLLHDLGKIGVPGTILDKPQKLTEEEFAVVKGHPEKGTRILEPIPAFRDIIPIVAQHHEWVNGRGYPRGLSGEDISRGARIVAVADVYDALTSDRPYRSGWRPERALSYLEENAGVQFDPVVVEVFRDLFPAGDTAVCIPQDDHVACPGV